VERHYPLGKADLYAAFLLRGLELVAPGGLSAMLTMRNWMFIQQFSELRTFVLPRYFLASVGDFSIGAFEDVANDVLSVASALFCLVTPRTERSIGQMPTKPSNISYDRGRTSRKRAATIAQEGLHCFRPAELKEVPQWPLVYWWSADFLDEYILSPKLSDVSPVKQGMATADNDRFLRRHWEAPISNIFISNIWSTHPNSFQRWTPYVKGSTGRAWIEPLEWIANCSMAFMEMLNLLDANKKQRSTAGKNSQYYYRHGVAFTSTGAEASSRCFRYVSVFDVKGQSAFPVDPASVCCVANSKKSRNILLDLNPTLSFQVGDILRLPYKEDALADGIFKLLREAFAKHERSREASVEFRRPSASPWRHAQDWAQQAVDRLGNSSLPDYIEKLDLEPPTDHLSFALGFALGRFAPVDDLGQPTTSNQPGILDPTSADLFHALPAGILFLDGSLEDNDHRDDLGQPAAAPLHQAWSRYGSAIAPSRSLRDWLRLDFFKDVHKGMYES
jgi:hypothetical protein